MQYQKRVLPTFRRKMGFGLDPSLTVEVGSEFFWTFEGKGITKKSF